MIADEQEEGEGVPPPPKDIPPHDGLSDEDDDDESEEGTVLHTKSTPGNMGYFYQSLNGKI